MDISTKSAGRGAYICHTPSCWQRGIEKGGLERSLKVEISTHDKSWLMDFYTKEILRSPE